MSIADNPIAEMLRGVQILRKLDDEIILDLAQQMKTTGFQANQVIVEKGHIGERIFANECAGKTACLTSWNEGEDFASMFKEADSRLYLAKEHGRNRIEPAFVPHAA